MDTNNQSSWSISQRLIRTIRTYNWVIVNCIKSIGHTEMSIGIEILFSVVSMSSQFYINKSIVYLSLDKIIPIFNHR